MSPRVLIVDDEPLIQSGVRAFLEDEGMEVSTAGSAEAAIELVRGGASFDVCIMDIRLPGIEGTLGIRELRKLSPELRFIVQTGSANYLPPGDLADPVVHELPLFRKPLTDMAPLADKVRALASR